MNAALLTSVRERLGAARAALRAAYLARPQPDRLLRRHAALVDEAIAELANGIGLPPQLALIAVGGYGRGFLFPASDVDIVVLLPDGMTADARIEAFVGLLWDVGLEPGIAVRSVADCIEEARKDVTVDTSLLEARHLWGEAALAERLTAALAAARDLPRFLEAKIAEQRARHARHNDVALNLEPNIKESPGGLRDLQTVLWIARATGQGNDWAALAANGLITPDEAVLMRKNRRVLIDLRIRLHYLAGRREDRLVFDHQSALASQLKLAPTRNKRPSEVLMRRYYLAAKNVWQLNSILLANLQERILPAPRGAANSIDAEFELVSGHIAAKDARLFARDPRAVFRAFIALQRTPAAEFFSADTLRAIWRAAPRIGPAFRADAEANRLFLDILRGERLTFSLRRMSRYGILGRYLPAFGRIVGQMQHDLFHVYTVDEHILMVLRNMRRLVLPRFAHEFPFCHELAREFDGVHLLYLACLFHDIAKGRGGDHSQLGRHDARRFCKQLGLGDADGELVVWLVGMHLVMSQTAQKQDLGDPEVISHFAALVGNERRLTALYLLTVADIRGTSPHVWNGWKAKLLEDLFRATRRLLRGDSTPNAHWIDFKRETAMAALGGIPPLWAHFDEGYFQRFDVEDMRWHVRVLGECIDAAVPHTFARADEASGALQVLVVARDQPGLFMRVTATFERLQLDVAAARIYTTRTGEALDSFLLLPKSRHVPDGAALAAKIERELVKALQSPTMPPPASARVARQARHFPIPPEIALRRFRGGPYFELAVTCADRPGLLSSIARVLNEHAVGLHDARITTLGSRVEDVFILDDARLADDAAGQALCGRIAAAIAPSA